MKQRVALALAAATLGCEPDEAKVQGTVVCAEWESGAVPVDGPVRLTTRWAGTGDELTIDDVPFPGARACARLEPPTAAVRRAIAAGAVEVDEHIRREPPYGFERRLPVVGLVAVVYVDGDGDGRLTAGNPFDRQLGRTGAHYVNRRLLYVPDFRQIFIGGPFYRPDRLPGPAAPFVQHSGELVAWDTTVLRLSTEPHLCLTLPELLRCSVYDAYSGGLDVYLVADDRIPTERISPYSAPGTLDELRRAWMPDQPHGCVVFEDLWLAYQVTEQTAVTENACECFAIRVGWGAVTPADAPADWFPCVPAADCPRCPRPEVLASVLGVRSRANVPAEDAGPPDAGPPDAGPPDAGPPDAGP